MNQDQGSVKDTDHNHSQGSAKADERTPGPSEIPSGMEKLQRYLGLVAGIAILVIAFYPHGGYKGRLGDLLDRSLIDGVVVEAAKYTRVRYSSDQLWNCQLFLKATDPSQASDLMWHESRNWHKCDPSKLFQASRSGVHELDFHDGQKAIAQAIAEFEITRSRLPPGRGLAGEPVPPWTPELIEFIRPHVVTMVDEFESGAASVAMAKKVLGVLFIALALACIAFRQQVGALLLAPFRVARDLATGLHRRV